MAMNFKDFLRNISAVSKGSDMALAELKTAGYLEEDSGSLGGFTVPEEAYDEILDVALEQSIVRPRAVVIPMTTDAISISRLVDTTHASTVLGGITASWKAEAASLTETSPAFGELTLIARKLTGFCYTSNEWLEDSKVGTEVLLTQAFGEAIAFYADKAYISGTGAGEPLGVLNSTCLITVAAEGSQTADTVRAENFGKMDARLDPRSQNDAAWFINHEVKPFLFPVLLNAGTIAAQQPGETEDGLFILGHPVRVTEKLPKVGDVGDILLADFGKYIIGDRGLTISASRHVKWTSDQTTWRFVFRTDGQPIPANAYIPLNATSSATVSPFVVLAARA